MSDLSGLTNPKRVLRKREIAAGLEEAPATPPAKASGPRFGKQFTPEEKAKQNAALIEKLRAR